MEFDQLENKSLPSLGNFFLDSDMKNINFSNPNCCEGHEDLNIAVIELCKKYQNIFSLNKMDIGKCNESDQVSFSLRSNTIPVNVRPYPVNRKLHDRAMKFIGKLLDLGLFRPAKQNVAWANPAFFLLKSPMLQQIHNGQEELIHEDVEDNLPVRLIINYAKFNSKVKKKVFSSSSNHL